MLIGAHSIIYSRNPVADRNFLRDVLGLPHVDVGEGWLIFGLPPAEVAVHPADENDHHEFYFMCDDIQAFVTEVSHQGIVCEPVVNQGWGLLTQVTLPGGGKLGVYQPRHARPKSAGGSGKSKSRRKPPGKKRPTKKLATKKRAKATPGRRATRKTNSRQRRSS